MTGYGFVVFTFGALCWIAVGAATHQPALLWTNVVLTFLDIFGIWRWLGRQTKVEEGGHVAAEASERTPGEALFPVSLLLRAPVSSGGRELGRCIDAMAGCSSGHLSYVVISEGGLAGVGEKLRRLPWNGVAMKEDVLAATISADQFERLEILPRDQWPGR